MLQSYNINLILLIGASNKYVLQNIHMILKYNIELFYYCLICCRNSKRTSIAVLLSQVTRRAIDLSDESWPGKAGAWSSDYMLSGLLHWHCCDTRCH